MRYTKMLHQESREIEKMMIDDTFKKLVYPANFIMHPDIGHVEVVGELLPQIVDKPLTFKEYIKYYQTTYEILCRDFDTYLEYLDNKFWKDFFRNKKRHDKI